MKNIYSALTLWLFTTLAYAQAQKIEVVTLRQQIWHQIVEYGTRFCVNFSLIFTLALVAGIVIFVLTKAINTVLSIEEQVA